MKVNADSVTVIGHGLGALMASYLGAYHYQLTSHKYRKIIGLDPARPLNRLNDKCKDFMCKYDGKQVIILHTNAHKYGIKKAIAHVDVFFNRGVNQPQCECII